MAHIRVASLALEIQALDTVRIGMPVFDTRIQDYLDGDGEDYAEGSSCPAMHLAYSIGDL